MASQRAPAFLSNLTSPILSLDPQYQDNSPLSKFSTEFTSSLNLQDGTKHHQVKSKHTLYLYHIVHTQLHSSQGHSWLIISPKRSSQSRQSSTSSSVSHDISLSTPAQLLSGNETFQATACPYHGSIVQMRSNGGGQSHQDMSPMDRFLAEGPGQQYALFVRPDNGQLSTSKGCTCGRNV